MLDVIGMKGLLVKTIHNSIMCRGDQRCHLVLVLLSSSVLHRQLLQEGAAEEGERLGEEANRPEGRPNTPGCGG